MRRWLLAALAVVLAILVGLRLELKWRVHRAINGLRSAGLPTRYEDLNRAYQINDSHQNFAAVLTNAMALISDGHSNLIDHIPYWGDAEQPRPGEPWPLEMRSAVSNYFRINREGMTRLRAATAITNACYFEDFNPEKWSVRAVVDAKTAAYRLGGAAVYEAEMGDAESATRDLVSVFHIADTLAPQPAIICRLVCMGVETLGVDFVEDALSRGKFTEEQLSIIRAALQKRIRDYQLTKAIRGERVFFLEPCWYGNGRASLTDQLFFALDPTSWEYQWDRAKVIGYRMVGLADRDVLACIMATREIEQTAAESVHQQYVMDTNWASAFPDIQTGRFRIWSSQALAAYERLLSGNVGAQLKLRAAATAIAVAEYRVKHENKLADSLHELVPEFIDVLPTDPRSDEPFELIISHDGYGIGQGSPVFKVRLNETEQAQRPAN